MNQGILITGGTGYIGSHTVVELMATRTIVLDF
jgi:UDP-glucose 4-epimerase